MGIASPNGVAGHLRALERAGAIRRAPGASRAITVNASPSNPARRQRGLPLAGRVAAGGLTEAVPQTEALELRDLFRGDDYLLEVRGDSMIDAQINDGDFVVVRPQTTAQPGSIVVVETDENEATLKWWYPEKRRIRLQPANRRMKPIYVSSAKVRGVVVVVIRKLT